MPGIGRPERARSPAGQVLGRRFCRCRSEPMQPGRHGDPAGRLRGRPAPLRDADRLEDAGCQLPRCLLACGRPRRDRLGGGLPRRCGPEGRASTWARRGAAWSRAPSPARGAAPASTPTTSTSRTSRHPRRSARPTSAAPTSAARRIDDVDFYLVDLRGARLRSPSRPSTSAAAGRSSPIVADTVRSPSYAPESLPADEPRPVLSSSCGRAASVPSLA